MSNLFQERESEVSEVEFLRDLVRQQQETIKNLSKPTYLADETALLTEEQFNYITERVKQNGEDKEFKRLRQQSRRNIRELRDEIQRRADAKRRPIVTADGKISEDR